MSLFEKAKGKAKPAAAKKGKEEIVITSEADFKNIAELSRINDEIASLTAQKEMIYGDVKQLGVSKFVEKYEAEKKYTESFKIVVRKEGSNDTAVVQIQPTDKYIKIDEDKATLLKNKYGEGIVDEQTTYSFDNDMLDKYGSIISKLIEDSKDIAEADKAKLIKADTKLAVKKGSIKEFRSNDNMRKFSVEEITNDLLPVFQIKGAKVEAAE